MAAFASFLSLQAATYWRRAASSFSLTHLLIVVAQLFAVAALLAHLLFVKVRL
jgi:hypothetical protein